MERAKRVLILGSDGFIGSRLFEKFSAAGQCRVKGLTLQDCDLLSADSTTKALSDIGGDDAVIITSAVTRLVDNTFTALVKNLQMAENVAAVLLQKPVKQLIFFSTVDVYGINIKRSQKIHEGLALDPNDHYAISKAASEFLFRKICRKAQIPLIVLRLCGVYGAGDRARSTIGALIASALEKNRITVYGKGDNLRDFIYVDDIFEVAAAAIDKGIDDTVNVATGKSLSILQIAEAIRSLLNGNVEIDLKPQPPADEKRIEDMVFDDSHFKELFPGLRMTCLKEGIAAYLENVRKER